MKKVFVFFMFLSFYFTYASIKDNQKTNELTISSKFVGVEIASFEFKDSNDLNKESNIHLEMLITYDELNNMFNEYVKKYNLNEMNYIETKIVSIYGKPYLRSYTDDGYVTTTGLKTTYSESYNGLVLITEGVSCTSKSCAENGGCVPEGGDRCTPCLLGDCTKTVTDEMVFN